MFHTFTKNFVQIKEDSQKKKALSDQNKQLGQNLFNGYRELDVLESRKRSIVKNSIFATYNTNFPPLEVQPTKTWKDYTPSELFPNIDDKLTRPAHFLFDYKLESQISSKPYEEPLGEYKVVKPQFLKNKIPRRSARRLDETNINIAYSSLLYEYKDDVYSYSKKEKIVNKVKKNKIKPSKKIIKPVKLRNFWPAEKEYNPHILEIRGSAIVISKSVEKYADIFDKVVILKKDIEPYLNAKCEEEQIKLNIDDLPLPQDQGMKMEEENSWNKNSATNFEIENTIFQEIVKEEFEEYEGRLENVLGVNNYKQLNGLKSPEVKEEQVDGLES